MSVAVQPVVADETVVVELGGAAPALVHVPWPLSERDAGTTAAGAAALLLLSANNVLVVSEPLGVPRSLTETLKSVAAAIREARA